MSRVIFVNRYFHPDHSATARLLSDLAFELAQRGTDVAVVTSRQRYDNAREQLPRRQTVRGVSIRRVAGSRFGRHNLAGRAIDYATFLLAVGVQLWRLVRRGDVVVFKTDPPMLGPLLAPIARLRRARVINWLQDLFPQVAVQAGVIGPALGKLLDRFCARALRRADRCVCVGESMAARLKTLGVDPVVIDNWVNVDALAAPADAVTELRRQWQVGDRFVVAYSGNLGRAHPIGALKEAILSLAHKPDILFLFTGGGVGYAELARWCRERDCGGVMFQPYQPESRLPVLLALGDIHLALLAPGFEGLIVPSKFSGITAAGRGCVFVGSPDGQIARWIDQAQCGLTATDGAQLAAAITRLEANRQEAIDMGGRAQLLARQIFARPLALERWQDTLRQVMGSDTAKVAQID